MEYIKLKNSELNVSRLCFGGCPMGGHGWGDVSEKNLIDAVHAAVDNGLNFFDNADTYGLGKSEETLGRALKGKREKAIIATKFGVRVENGQTYYDNSAEWINTAVERSLKRLGTDYIDLYQIHYRDNKTPIGEVVEALESLQKKGYIRYFGLSNIFRKDIIELKPHINKFVSFQNEYSLANRENEIDILDVSKDLEMTPLTWGSLGQGILTGKYNRDSNFSTNDRRSRDIYVNFHGDKLVKNMDIVDAMRRISEETGKPIPSIAIRFILDNIQDSVVLAGIKTPQQLVSNMDAMGWNLSDNQLSELDRISKE